MDKIWSGCKIQKPQKACGRKYLYFTILKVWKKALLTLSGGSSIFFCFVLASNQIFKQCGSAVHPVTLPGGNYHYQFHPKCLFKKYLVNTYYVPGTILWAEDIMVNERG